MFRKKTPIPLHFIVKTGRFHAFHCLLIASTLQSMRNASAWLLKGTSKSTLAPNAKVLITCRRAYTFALLHTRVVADENYRYVLKTTLRVGVVWEALSMEQCIRYITIALSVCINHRAFQAQYLKAASLWEEKSLVRECHCISNVGESSRHTETHLRRGEVLWDFSPDSS